MFLGAFSKSSVRFSLCFLPNLQIALHFAEFNQFNQLARHGEETATLAKIRVPMSHSHLSEYFQAWTWQIHWNLDKQNMPIASKSPEKMCRPQNTQCMSRIPGAGLHVEIWPLCLQQWFCPSHYFWFAIWHRCLPSSSAQFFYLLKPPMDNAMLAKMQREARWKEGVACHSRAWKGCSLLYSQCRGESRKVRQKSGWRILRLLQLSINRDDSVFSPGLTPSSCSFSGQLEIHAGGTSPTGDPVRFRFHNPKNFHSRRFTHDILPTSGCECRVT